jgi:hypothetical protein
VTARKDRGFKPLKNHLSSATAIERGLFYFDDFVGKQLAVVLLPLNGDALLKNICFDLLTG